MSNVTIRTCVLGVDAYYCKDMFRIRADILELSLFFNKRNIFEHL